MKVLFSLIFSLSLVLELHAEIVESCAMADVRCYADAKTLIIFDIDNTIYEPIQALGSDQWYYHYFDKLVKEGMNPQRACEEAVFLCQKIQWATKVQPIEKDTPDIIKSLQRSGLRVMALTTRGSNVADATCRQLASLGIDMRETAPHPDNFTLTAMPEVLWQSGVLFTKGVHKGKAFLAFLEQSGFRPERVLFINDRGSHLCQLEEGCKELGIPFVGLRYAAADEKVKNYRPEIAEVQLQQFQILSDEAAAAMLQK